MEPLNFLIEIARIAPIFDTIAFWAVVSGIAPIFLVFLFIAMALAKVKSTLWVGDTLKPSPFGMLAPLLGLPATIPKSRDEIVADREHAYRRWGSMLSLLCISGGLFLFVIGATQPADIEYELVGKLTNVSPGTVLFLIGLRIWTSVHK